MRKGTIWVGLLMAVTGCPSPVVRQGATIDNSPMFVRALDSALKTERAKGIFIDTTKSAAALRGLPLMIYSDAQMRHILADLSRTAVTASSDFVVEGSQSYQVIVVDSTGHISGGSPAYAQAARTSFGAVADVARPMSEPFIRLVATETPRPEQFPAAALTTTVGHQPIWVADYVERRLFDSGWPTRAEIDRGAKQVRLITDYILEPVQEGEHRQRRTAYMISLSDSASARCTRISLRWLTQSKGDRESSWATIQGDSTYSPVNRRGISTWFANLETCKNRGR